MQRPCKVRRCHNLKSSSWVDCTRGQNGVCRVKAHPGQLLILDCRAILPALIVGTYITSVRKSQRQNTQPERCTTDS